MPIQDFNYNVKNKFECEMFKELRKYIYKNSSYNKLTSKIMNYLLKELSNLS